MTEQINGTPEAWQRQMMVETPGLRIELNWFGNEKVRQEGLDVEVPDDRAEMAEEWTENEGLGEADYFSSSKVEPWELVGIDDIAYEFLAGNDE